MVNFILSLFFGWPGIMSPVILVLVGSLRVNNRFLVAVSIFAFPFFSGDIVSLMNNSHTTSLIDNMEKL
jgi:hypothetical protein